MKQPAMPPIGDEQPAVIGLSVIWSENSHEARPSKVALFQHVARRSLENIRRSPVTALLTLLSISTALFLLGLFGLLSQNVARARGIGAHDVKAHLFVRDGISDGERGDLLRDLERIAPGGRIAFTSQGDALQDFREMLAEDAIILEGLDANNPLPASVSVAFDDWKGAEPVFARIEKDFTNDPRIDTIRFSRKIAAQLGRIFELFRVVGYVGLIFLVFVAGFITSNTISLALFGHRMEIEIMRLVGAQRGSIYASYVLEGFLQGGCGAFLAIATLSLVFFSLKDAVASVEPLAMIIPSVSFLSVGFLLFIIVVGVLIGTVSSFLAVRRFLRAG